MGKIRGSIPIYPQIRQLYSQLTWELHQEVAKRLVLGGLLLPVICWYDIPVGRKNRYPNFIILHPTRGMLFLEVQE